MLKQYALALPILRDRVSRAPSLRQGHVFLAATYARLGQAEEAAAEVAEVLRLCPEYTIAGTGRRLLPFKLATDDEHYFDGLRKAGRPEQSVARPQARFRAPSWGSSARSTIRQAGERLR